MWSVIGKASRQRALLAVFAAAALLAVGLGVITPESAQAATLYISEFPTGVTNSPGSDQAQIYPQTAITDQTVGLSGTTARSAAFNAKTHAVMLMCDEGCSVSFGTSTVTATTSNFLLQQGVSYYFGVSPGGFVASIANSAGNSPGGGGSSVVVSSRISTLSTTVTRPNDSAPYAANDALSDSTSAPTAGGFTLTSACSASGGNGTIQSAVISASAGTAYQGEIWIFDQSVTAINDNAAFSVSDSDVLNLVGVIPFSTTDTTSANAASYVTGLNVGYTCVGTANLRFLVKILNVVTPAANEVLSVRVQVQN